MAATLQMITRLIVSLWWGCDGNFKHRLGIYFLSIQVNIIFKWMQEFIVDAQSALVQLMAWCRQATSHDLNQCCPRSHGGDVKSALMRHISPIFFRLTTTRPSEFYIMELFVGISSGFHAHRASNGRRMSMPWRHGNFLTGNVRVT